MMKIKEIIWQSKEAKEAEVVICDGNYECIAYCHPCNIQQGSVFSEPLHAFMLKDLMISDSKNYSIEAIKPGLSYRCNAKVVNINSGIVRIGDIYILIEDPFPFELIEDDYIEFTCLRLDLW